MHRIPLLIGCVLALPVVVLATCVGCGQTSERPTVPVDMTLLTGEPCEPPCWHGLTPGMSTEEDVNEFLATSELVDQSTLFRGDLTSGLGEVVGVAVQWWSRADMASGPSPLGNHLSIRDGVLHNMIIGLDVEVTLQDLLERYGPPDKFSAWAEGVEVPYVNVSLYYPRHGLMVTVIIPLDDPQLTPESEAVQVWYFRTASLEDLLVPTRDARYPSVSEDTLQDWHGYGPIELVP